MEIITKRALITGITGQDGSYLAELLLSKGYKVFGLMRRTSLDPYTRIEELVTKKKVDILVGNLRDLATIRNALEIARPDEIYNLAAQSDVRKSFDIPDETKEINYLGFIRLVDEAMKVNSNARIYQASTSEMFGSTPPPQNENTKFSPQSPYAKSKLSAHEFLVNHRERYGSFICSGFLFNHESPRRGVDFVTRKIVRDAIKIKLGQQEILELGNLAAERDWGYAGDYVQAMWLMLQQGQPDDFVIATGKTNTVKHFVELTFRELGMELGWSGNGLDEFGFDKYNGKFLVFINPTYFRPKEVGSLCGDASKAKAKLGWKPKITLEELIRMMVVADLKLLST